MNIYLEQSSTDDTKYKNVFIPRTSKIVQYSRNELTKDIDEKILVGVTEGIHEDYQKISIEDLHKVKIDESMLSNIAIPSLNSYGAAFEKAFDDNFAFISEYRDSIKALEVVRFEIFDFKFKEKVTSLIKDRNCFGLLTIQQMLNLM